MENYIFLDIDGVLNSRDYFHSDLHQADNAKCIDPVAAELLKTIVQKTSAKIVLSSTHRRSDDYKARLKRHGYPLEDLPIFDKTPSFYGIKSNTPGVSSSYIPRGLEIESWLKCTIGFQPIFYNIALNRKNCEKANLNNYVIIDDDSDMLHNQRLNFILTPNAIGLKEWHAEKIINILSTPFWELDYYNETCDRNIV